MAIVYCEICGEEIPGIRSPERLIRWRHREIRMPISCFRHRRATLYRDSHRLIYDPLTGQRKENS